jgi:type II secretory pathway pseudopilin PulG
MNKNYKNEKGFTLVELLILVLISSTLFFVGIKNFKYYQAKQRQFDAKIQLAFIYKAELETLAEYHTYATCLTSIDYSTPTEGYYVVGFKEDEKTSIDLIMSSWGGYCEADEFAIRPGILHKVNNSTPDPTAEGQLFLGEIKESTKSTHFTVAAAGNISSEVPYDIWTIDQAKKVTNVTIGFETP